MQLQLCSNLANSECLPGRVLDKFASADSGALTCCLEINRSVATQVMIYTGCLKVRTRPDVLLFGRLWYEQAPDAIEYAKFCSRSHDAVIRVYNHAGNVIETHEHKGDFKEW
jgi:hypothetical protein